MVGEAFMPPLIGYPDGVKFHSGGINPSPTGRCFPKKRRRSKLGRRLSLSKSLAEFAAWGGK